MANLTGEFDVATEISLGFVNCILATMHENEDENYPRFPHSLATLIDDSYRGPADPVPESERTAIRTLAEVQLSPPTASFPQQGLPDQVMTRGRAVAAVASSPRHDVAAGPGVLGPIGPGGGASCWPRVSARLNLRAWLRDEPEGLPQFVHGDLHITTALIRTDLRRLGTFISQDPGSLEIRFEPAPGTSISGEQVELAERILRNFIRSDSEPLSFKVDLPAEVRHFDYELLAAGPVPSAMLRFKLDGAAPGTPAPAGAGARFLPPGADFAVGVGRDYLLGQLERVLAGARPQLLPEYVASGTGYSARVRPDWDGAAFHLEPGRIVFTLSGTGSVTYGFGPLSATDGWSFSVRQAIALHVVGGVVKPVIEEDPQVTLHDVAAFEGTIREKARENIRAALEGILDSAPPELTQALDVGKPLKQMLANLHPSDPGVAITGADIRPEGVVFPGTVALAPSRPVAVKRTSRGGIPDALDSWIPGGTIDRFVWGQRVEEHRFVTEPAGPMGGAVGIRCLSVQGTRVTRGGALAPVRADDCPILVAMLPVLSDPPPPQPCRRPMLPLLERSEEGVEVVGHYDPWASGLTPARGPTNVLLQFCAGTWEDDAEKLDQALARAGKDEAAVVVIGILGSDTLAGAIEASLDADVALLLTEDPKSRWAERFGVSSPQATVLIGPGGEVRHSEEGPLDPAKLAKVLDKSLEPGGEVSWRALGLAVGGNDRAPEVALRLGDGREIALRRLRGGTTLLSFWTSCSPESIEQLRELRSAVDSSEREGLAAFGIGDGEDPRRVSELAKREQLPFPLIADPDRSIARRYGVSSWPTTVEVGPDGAVHAVDLGLVRGISPCSETAWPPLTRAEGSHRVVSRPSDPEWAVKDSNLQP
jgi:peroxiredoxin